MVECFIACTEPWAGFPAPHKTSTTWFMLVISALRGGSWRISSGSTPASLGEASLDLSETLFFISVFIWPVSECVNLTLF